MACGQLTINNEPLIQLKIKSAVSKFIRDNDVKQLVDNIVSGLNKNSEFTLNTIPEYNLLKDKIEELVNINGRLSNEQKQTILDNYTSYLAPHFQLSLTETTNIVQPSEQIVETEEITEQPENSQLKISTLDLDDFYGEAFNVKAYMIDKFQRDLLNHSIINFTTGRRIKNSTDLNNEIASLKQELFNSLVDYLNISGNVSHVNSFYNDGKLDNINYNTVLNEASQAFSRLERSELISAFNNIHKVDRNGRDFNRKLVNGFNAYSALVNFDSILKKSFGNIISITPVYEGMETDVDRNKYKLFISGNLIKTWRTNENVDALKELGHVSRLLIEQTPLVDRYSKIPYEGKYLNMGLFLGVTNKLRDESILSKLSTDSRTYKNLINFHNAPNYYLGHILEDVLAGRLQDAVKFNRTDLNVITSIYERFYRTKTEGSQNFSLKDIMLQDISSSEAMTDFDVLECIAGVIDRSCGTKYTQYYRDSDGNIQTKEISTVNVDKAQLQEQNNINIYNKFRGDKESIISKYNVKEDGEYISAIVEGKEIKLKVLGTGKGIDSGIHRSLEGFDLDFSKFKQYYDLGQGVSFSEQERLYAGLVQFIDDFLNTRFLNGNIDLLSKYVDNEMEGIISKKIPLKTRHLDNLLSSALISANSIRITNDFIKSGETDVETYAVNNSKYYADRLSGKKRGYVSNNLLLSVNPEGNKSLEGLVRAKQELSGDLYKTTVKNNAGDNIPTNGISNLASYFTNYVHEQTKDGEYSVFNSNIFAGDNISSLDGISVKTDGENRNGVKKSASNFTMAELSYTSILFDYFGNRFNTKSGGAKVKIQPTTYSDKSRQYLFGINIDKLKNKAGVSFKNMTLDQVKEFKRDSAKGFYKSIFNNILSDYKEVYAENYEVYLNYLKNGRDNIPAKVPAYERISKKIEAQIEKIKTNNMNVQDDMDLDWSGPLDSLNIQDFTDLLSVTKYWEYNDMSLSAGVSNVENLHVSKNKTNSFLKPNNSLVYKATVLYDKDSVYEERQKIERKKFLRDLIDSNTKFWTRFSDGSNNTELLNVLNHFGIYANQKDETWVDHNVNELVLAKTLDGKPITRESILENNILASDEDIELNPMLEQYFYEYSTLAENLRLLLTGAESGHPFKSDESYSMSESSYKDFQAEESSRAKAQLKRNVIIPATLQYFMQKSILGIPSSYKLAVVSDLPAKVFNFKGESASIDSMDGSALVHPIMAILENYSLQDSSVGMNKKPIGHGMKNRYGVAELLKFATFAMDNEWVRVSSMSDVKLGNLIKSMSLNWDPNAVDLTKNIFGKPMGLAANTKGNRIFYRNGLNHYEVLDLTKNSESPDNMYTWTYAQVDSRGNRIEDAPLIQVSEAVNNVYDLWQKLGGEYSESLNSEGKLEFSNASLETAANYANNVGKYNGNGEYPTQLNTYQPIKDTMIAYIVNKSAIKVGAENINPDAVWTDPKELSYFNMSTRGLGVQMDADHHADEATMTEFTQVLSSIEANGWTHDISKLTYEDLGKATLSLIKDKSEAAKLYLATNNKSDMYEIIGKELIKNIREDDNKVGLSKSIIDIIRKEFREFRNTHDNDEYKIPFSDSNLQAISISTFTSGINSKAIKKKHPGIGAVMVPGFGTIQNFILNGESYSFDDIYDMAAEKGMTPQEFLASIQSEIESQAPLTIDKLNPGDRVKVIDPTGALIEYTIDDLKIYNFVKSNFSEFYPDVTKGHDLKPVQITWEAAGKHYNVFDIPAIQEAVRIRSDEVLSKNLTKKDNLLMQNKIQKAFKSLDSGYMPLTSELQAQYEANPEEFIKTFEAISLDGQIVIPVQNLQNKPAELVLSKLYASIFNLNNNDSVAKIKQQGVQYFIDRYNKYHLPQTFSYDLMFTQGNGNHTYIVYDLEGLENVYKVEEDDNNVKIGNIVYKTDSQGNRLYKIRDGEKTFVDEYRMLIGSQEIRLLHVSNPEYINDIYHSYDFDSVKVRETSSITDSFLELNKKNKYLYSLIGKNASEVDSINMARVLPLAKKQYTSFLKSLEFTASRIPAQTLQSFMKMEVKQFSGSDKNVAFVSHWQTW